MPRCTWALLATFLLGACQESNPTLDGDDGGVRVDLTSNLGSDDGMFAPRDLYDPNADLVHLRTGAIVAVVGSDQNNVPFSTVAAWFVEGQAGLAGATLKRVGPCAILDGLTPDGYPGGLSAGAITVEGGSAPVTLTPDGQNHYAGYFKQGQALWQGGESLTVRAAGAGLPAFNSTVTAPATVDVVEPPRPSPSLAIDRTKPLAVRWAGGRFGEVQFNLNAANASPVICTFPAKDGSGTIPAEVLGTLPAKSQGAISARVSAGILDDFVSGPGYRVALDVQRAATWNGSAVAGGTFTTN